MKSEKIMGLVRGELGFAIGWLGGWWRKSFDSGFTVIRLGRYCNWIRHRVYYEHF